MTSVKGKEAGSSGDRGVTEADVQHGNPAVQVKEEPPDMDEYLKSSEVYAQAHAKPSPVVKSAQRGKAVISQASKSISGPSVAPKPTTTVAKKSAVGQQEPRIMPSTAEAKKTLGQSTVKTPISAVKSVGCANNNSKALMSSTVGKDKVPPGIQMSVVTSVFQKLPAGPGKSSDNQPSGIAAMATSSSTTGIVSVALKGTTSTSVSSVSSSSINKDIPEGSNVRQPLAGAKGASLCGTKGPAPSLSVKSNTSISVPNKATASNVQKEPLGSKAASKPNSNVNVSTAPQNSSDGLKSLLQKAPAGSKPPTDDGAVKGPVLRNRTNVRSVADVAKSVPTTAAASAVAAASAQNKQCSQDKLPEGDFSEVVIKSEPLDDYPDSAAAAPLQLPMPEASMENVPSAPVLSSLPQANSNSNVAGISVASDGEIPTCSQNLSSAGIIPTEALSSVETSTMVGENCVTTTVESSSSVGLLTSDEVHSVSVIAGTEIGAIVASSSASVGDVVVSTEISDVDLSIVKTEPLEEQLTVEPSTAVTNTVSADESFNSTVSSNNMLNILDKNISMADNVNLSGTLAASVDNNREVADNLTHISTETINDVRYSATDDVHTNPVIFNPDGATTELSPDVTGNVLNSVGLTKYISAFDDHNTTEKGMSDLPMDLDMHQAETVTNLQEESAASDPFQQIPAYLTRSTSEVIHSANEESVTDYGRVINQSLLSISTAYEASAGFSEVSESPASLNVSEARPVFSTLSPQTVCFSDPCRSGLTKETQITTNATKSLRDRKVIDFEQIGGTNRTRDELVNKDKDACSGALAVRQEKNVFSKTSVSTNEKMAEKSKSSVVHSDFDGPKEIPLEKRVIRRKRPLDNASAQTLDTVPKHRRSSSPRIGKENASRVMKFHKNDNKNSSHSSIQRKVLAANLMPNQEKGRYKKNPMENVSEYMELSSILTDDLRSECDSTRLPYAYTAKKSKQWDDLNTEEKRRNWISDRRRPVFKRSSDFRHSRKKLKIISHFLHYSVLFPALSEFSKHSLNDCSWYITSCEIEDIVASHRQDLISDLNSVYIGKQPRFLLSPMAHLGSLSLETQLDSQVIDSASVKSVFLEVAKEWARKKPLHLFMNGQLKVEKKTYLPPKRISKINVISETCQKMFSRDICRMLADICELGESEDGLFPLPDGLSQFTTNRVFRKVKQYLRNYVKRLKRNWSLERELHYELRNFQGDDLLCSTATKSKEKSAVSDPVVCLSLPSPDTIIRMQENQSFGAQGHLRSFQQNSVAAVETSAQQESNASSDMECVAYSQNDVVTSLFESVTSPQPVSVADVGCPSVISYDAPDRFLTINTSRISAEASVPFQTSLSSAYDKFCKEAESICEKAGKDKDWVNFSTRGSAAAANSVIDSSKLYSPTRPTDMEEQEMGINTTVEVADLEVGNDDDVVSGATQIAVETGKEFILATDESQSMRKRDKNKVVALNEDVQAVREQSEVTVIEQDEDEIEICVSHEESFTESEPETTKQQRIVRSEVAIKPKDTVMKKANENSIKRKKRKSTKEKKQKKKRDKHKIEIYESPERYRPRKKKKYKHASEDNKENVPAMALGNSSCASKLLRVCTASKSDAVYIDSYKSVVEDVINSVPVSNFEENFDPLLPPSGHYQNPFRLSWQVLEWFTSKNTGALSKLVGIIPDVNGFSTKILKPQTSFLWSLVLAVFDGVRPEPTEPESGKKGVDPSVVHESFKPSADEVLEVANIGDDGIKKVSVKGSNPLMQAFRQVVEAKRRLSKDSQKPKPMSAISKLSAELAARRAAPKSAKPLYRPSEKPERSEAAEQKNPENNGLSSQNNDNQTALLVKEALIDFYDEIKKLLNSPVDNDIEDEASYISSCANISDGSTHLEALSSLVWTLYKNYEECCKESCDQIDKNNQNEQLEEEEDEEIVIVVDNGDVEDGSEETGRDNAITLHQNDVDQSPSCNVEERSKDAAETGANQFPNVDEGFSLSSEGRVEAAEVPVAEKQICKTKNVEEGVEIATKNNLGLGDRQYISSFPPIGPSKKKPKVHSQVPRMVFAKLIGPALERLGTTVSASGSPAASEISSMSSSSSACNAATSVAVASSAVSSEDAVSTVARVAENVRNLSAASGSIESSSVASVAVVSNSFVESIALPSKPSVAISTTQATVASNMSSNKAVTQTTKATSTNMPKLSTSVGSTSASQNSFASLPSSSSVSVGGPSVVNSVSATQTSVPSSSTITVSEKSGLPSNLTDTSALKDLPAQPPLPTTETEMMPPPMPPIVFSQTENSTASSSADNSAYYQNAYSGFMSSTSQSQDYLSSYYGYGGQTFDQTQSWMYDPNMHYAASTQVPFVDPAMMSYPPPMTSEQVPFFLPPTNQPPPFLPTPAGAQLFPAYSSSQPAAPFSVPPPSMLPITVPPPSIPPSVLPPPIMDSSVPPPIMDPSVPPPIMDPSVPPPPIIDSSVPPPSVFLSAAPLQTSVPPPLYSSFSLPWSHDSSDPSNAIPFITPDVVPSSQPSVSSSSIQPPFALEQQQTDPLHSVHEIIKYPPPPLPGGLQVSAASVSSSQVQQSSSKLSSSNQFPSQSGNASQNPLQPVQEHFVTKSSNISAVEHAKPQQVGITSQGQHFGKGKNESQNQMSTSKMNAKPSNQEVPDASLSRNDYDSRSQPWYVDNQQMSKKESVLPDWSNEAKELPSLGHGSRKQDSLESNIAARQPGLNGSEQWLSGSQHVSPNVQQRPAIPQQMLKTPPARQLGPEPRQFNLQQRPFGSETKGSGPRVGMHDSGPGPSGALVRPSGPRQMASGLQTGPESKRFGQQGNASGQMSSVSCSSQELRLANAPGRPTESIAGSSSMTRLHAPESKQLNSQFGSSESGDKKHSLMLRDFNAQMRPELKQTGQWTKQQGKEPIQPGHPQRLAGAQLRPPMAPDQRMMRPGMLQRHPGPGQDQEISLQRGIDSHVKPGHSSHGNVRLPMESKTSDFGNTDQMPGGVQLRPPFNLRPQMQPGLKQGRPMAPVGPDQRQGDPAPRRFPGAADSVQRFSGQPVDSLPGNSGLRGVAPLLGFKPRINEDPKVRPLMDISIRKPVEGGAGTDATSCPERGGGHLSSQGGVSNLRFYVFNIDRPVCRATEQFLLRTYARKFDPHNINALRAMPEIRCLLLVHKEDLRNVQKIPSLLRLKRDLRVTFAAFTDPADIQQRRFMTFFPRAGTVVMDMTALLACKSDVLDGICQFMTSQTVEKRTPWKLMLPSNVFNAIDFLKYKYEDDPEEHVRLAELSQAMTAHKASGIVELLPEHPYRGQPRTIVEYQACCVALQINRLASFRHFLFITDMPRNHPDANLFLSNGIDVLNIPEFMRCFVSCNVEHRPKLHPPYITRVTLNKYADAVISNAAECLSL